MQNNIETKNRLAILVYVLLMSHCEKNDVLFFFQFSAEEKRNTGSKPEGSKSVYLLSRF